MITKEFGALHPAGDMLMLNFQFKMWEEDIFKDIQRIVLETEFQAKAEFKKAIPEFCVQNFFEYLVRLFAAQSLIAPSSATSIVVKIPKKDLTKLSFAANDFDQRVVASANDDSVLTEEERRKIDKIRIKYMPELHAYMSPN